MSLARLLTRLSIETSGYPAEKLESWAVSIELMMMVYVKIWIEGLWNGV